MKLALIALAAWMICLGSAVVAAGVAPARATMAALPLA
jgi:hypothetical protein